MSLIQEVFPNNVPEMTASAVADLNRRLSAAERTSGTIPPESIDGGEHIRAGTVTAAALAVGQLSAISADMGALVAGNITFDDSPADNFIQMDAGAKYIRIDNLGLSFVDTAPTPDKTLLHLDLTTGLASFQGIALLDQVGSSVPAPTITLGTGSVGIVPAQMTVGQLSAITADVGLITAGELRGTVYRTSATAGVVSGGNAGAGVVVDPSGVRSYSGTGTTPTLNLVASTGNLTLSGTGSTITAATYQTAASGNRIWISGTDGMHADFSTARVFDFNPNDGLGLRMHLGTSYTDMLRISPSVGLLLKMGTPLINSGGTTGLKVKFISSGDGTTRGEIFCDSVFSNTLEGHTLIVGRGNQFNTGGSSSARLWAALEGENVPRAQISAFTNYNMSTLNCTANIQPSSTVLGVTMAYNNGGFVNSRFETVGVGVAPAFANIAGELTCGSWVRVKGTNGIYFHDYGGGWNMSDGTYLRSYNAGNYILSNYSGAEVNLFTLGTSAVGGSRLGQWPGIAASTWVYLTRFDASQYQDLALGGLYAMGVTRYGPIDDLAEVVDARPEDVLERGEVVCLDTDYDEFTERFRVRRAGQHDRETALGIVSSRETAVIIMGRDMRPDGRLGTADIQRAEQGRQLLALAGMVPVRVTTENGPVLAGDPLTVSTGVPGRLMRASEPGRVVGYALEDTDRADDDLFMKVEAGWWGGPAQERRAVRRRPRQRRNELGELLYQQQVAEWEAPEQPLSKELLKQSLNIHPPDRPERNFPWPMHINPDTCLPEECWEWVPEDEQQLEVVEHG